MGLSHSKAYPRVTKVAPLQDKEEERPSAGPVDSAFNQNLGEESAYSLARLQDQNRALEGQLPPLRETWYGRYSSVPRAMYFDIPLEQRETSIIKRHPPRRLQKLEPIDLPRVVPSGRIPHLQEASTTHKAKQELEKKMQIPMYTSGKRQYLHKMQMLEKNRKRQEAQLELKKSLLMEATINKEKLTDHKAKRIPHSNPGNEDGDFLTSMPDEILNPSPGNSQNAEFLGHQARKHYYPRKIGKMETWLREQEAQGQFVWDSSSSDSDELGTVKKKQRALVRTRTERIPLFDEFFDRE
ncbi:factor associated with metabolism and energy isoform 1-T1 [Rhynchonycteris naso]